MSSLYANSSRIRSRIHYTDIHPLILDSESELR